MIGQRPVTPRYSSGAEETARHAPIADRRDAPTTRRMAPALRASQFSALLRSLDRAYETSASMNRGTEHVAYQGSRRSSPLLPPVKTPSATGFARSVRAQLSPLKPTAALDACDAFKTNRLQRSKTGL